MSMKLALHDMGAPGGGRTLGRPDPDLPPAIESVMITDPQSLEAESIRGLRTRLVAQHLREGRRALAICSPAAGSGCSYIALNLAVAAAQAGIRTVLVDANLRDPVLADLCGLPIDMPGLADYLASDRLALPDVVDTALMPDLAVVGAGDPADNPQELLSGARFRGLVDQLLREYELTIFDTAPANLCSDGQRVATMAGFSLLVARKHETYVNDMKTLAKQLRADKSVVVGAVLNDF
ncbi:protein tyrosine kinase [Sphingomonas changnyeongensis]|uniref:Protein tyrosine kinase n=1 Tax=Sphingomonas changnyeongensis TaxID=2698679 RepID=A0A7Z2NUN6_9SPHN|nr:CpsD/CapB family tyrosine-protein kinase [Sphingomonas changnyeongensis]QHL90125.1 protein tyrosine kinase [Sphingomonas changnyeongensis]